MKSNEGELRKAITKQYTDSHTPWPEMKPIDRPDTFADKILTLLEATLEERVRRALVEELQNCMASAYLEDVGKTGQVKGYCSERLSALQKDLLDKEQL